MGYSTDGSSHKDGIKNEQNLIETLQQQARQLYPQLSDDFEVVKRGGTKYKQDMEIVDGDDTILISAKKKTEIGSGSFDWTNSSAATKTIPCLKVFSAAVKLLLEMKWMFLVGSFMTFPVTYPDFIEISWHNMPFYALWRIGFVVICTTFFTYFLNVYALKTLPPTTIGAFAYLQPIITIIYYK